MAATGTTMMIWKGLQQHPYYHTELDCMRAPNAKLVRKIINAQTADRRTCRRQTLLHAVTSLLCKDRSARMWFDWEGLISQKVWKYRRATRIMVGILLVQSAGSDLSTRLFGSTIWSDPTRSAFPGQCISDRTSRVAEQQFDTTCFSASNVHEEEMCSIKRKGMSSGVSSPKFTGDGQRLLSWRHQKRMTISTGRVLIAGCSLAVVKMFVHTQKHFGLHWRP